jgi:ubiquinone/menaquinone biosynthesis C-methylase UbiE
MKGVYDVKDLVERYFDRAAALYNDATSTDEAWTMPRHVADILSSINGDFCSALAIGAGTGYDVDLLKQHDIPNIIMMDISRKMLDAAAERHPDVPQVHADIMDHASVDGRFDLILCIGVAEFISDMSRFLSRCADLLNAGGTLIVSYEPIIKGYKPQEARSELIHSREQNPIYDCDGVYIFRLELAEFAALCGANGFETVDHSLVLAYIDEASIFYGLATLRRTR